MSIIDGQSIFARARTMADRKRVCEERVAAECLKSGWDRKNLSRDQMEGLVRLVRYEESVAHAAAKLQTEAFVREYCKAIDWSRENLSVDQVNRIMLQPGYTLNRWCNAELPDDLRDVERSMPPYIGPVGPGETT